jgi:cellobiose-specific phosphotransferase system component IIC
MLCILLAALAFFIAAFFLWAAQHLGGAGAAAVTGGALLVIAVLVGIAGDVIQRRMRRQYQANQPSDLGRLVGLAARLGPKKAVILSVIVGAVAEYLAADRKKPRD